MKLGELFDVMLDTYIVHMQCLKNDLDFIALSNDPIFDQYLNRDVLFIGKRNRLKGVRHYEINIIIK